MGSTRRRFTDEYRQHAVRLVLDSGDTVAEIARSIGVHEMTLGKWVKKARDDGEESARPLDEDVEIIEVIGGIGLSVERWRRRSPLTRTYFGLGGRKCL